MADMAREASTVWNDVLRRVTPPSGIGAYADWFTGIIRINTTQEAWQRLLKRGPRARSTPEEDELYELFVHEAYHVIQFCSTAYLYHFATQLTVEITDWFRSGDFAPGGEQFLREALTAPVPAQLSATIRDSIAALDEPGPEGITTRSIVESGAFLVQKRTFDDHLPHAAYVKLLDTWCPSPDYRAAYDLASRHLGEATPDVYPLLASLALCTFEPAAAFITLCAQAIPRGLVSFASGSTSVDIDGLLDLAASSTGSFLGMASNLADSLPFAHPVYGKGARAFKTLAGSNVYKACAFMLMPHRFWTGLGELVLQLSPFVFNAPKGLAMILPPELRSTMSRDEQEQAATDLVAAAAIYARIMEGA